MILSFLHHCILSDRIFTRVSRLKANLTIVGIATACNTMSKVARPIILINQIINAIQRCGYQRETTYHIKEKILTRYN